MSHQNFPKDERWLHRTIAALEKRIKTLESAPRAGNTSISHGSLEVRDGDTGTTLAVLSSSETTDLNGAPVVAGLSAETGDVNGDALRDGTVGSEKVNFTARDLSGISTTLSATEPSSPVEGDIWIDSGNGNLVKRWNGTAFESLPVGTDAIQAEAITASLIAANTIGAGQIAAGAITAESIAADAIDGKTITGATVVSPDYDPGVAGYSINSDGSAEFNDADIRGTVDVGTDTTPNVIIGTINFPGGGTAQGLIQFTDPGDIHWSLSGYVAPTKTSDGTNEFGMLALFPPVYDGDPSHGQPDNQVSVNITQAPDGPVQLESGHLLANANTDSGAMLSQPGFGTTATFVDFTAAQFPPLSIVCPPAETILIGTRMSGYNNNSTASTLAVAPKVKAGSTVLADPSLLTGPFVTIGSTTLTNNIQTFIMAVIGQDVLAGREGQTLTIVPNWRISSGSDATANLSSAAMWVFPSPYPMGGSSS